MRIPVEFKMAVAIIIKKQQIWEQQSNVISKDT
jgi:hypothetical protein